MPHLTKCYGGVCKTEMAVLIACSPCSSQVYSIMSASLLVQKPTGMPACLDHFSNTLRVMACACSNSD